MAKPTASTTVRRPLPALISLLALLLLTGIVWWRVVNRDDHTTDATSCPSPSPSTSQAAALPAPSTVTLQVVNATKRSGLAGKVRTSLQQYGFRVPTNAINDPLKKKIRASAQIRFGPTGRTAASLLRYYFPGAQLVPTTARNAVVVIALGDKYRAIASQTAVNAAVKGDKLTIASAAPTPSPGASSSSACKSPAP